MAEEIPLEKVRAIVKEMIDANMSREEIIAGLQDIGLSEPEKIVAEALGEAAPPAPEQAPPAAPPAAPEEQPPEEWPSSLFEAPRKEEEIEEKILGFEAPAALAPARVDELNTKLEEVIALLKALQEVDRQVLATLREVLLRLRQQA